MLEYVFDAGYLPAIVPGKGGKRELGRGGWGGGGAGNGYLANPAKPALTKKGVLTVFWKLKIIILAYKSVSRFEYS